MPNAHKTHVSVSIPRPLWNRVKKIVKYPNWKSEIGISASEFIADAVEAKLIVCEVKKAA